MKLSSHPSDSVERLDLLPEVKNKYYQHAQTFESLMRDQLISVFISKSKSRDSKLFERFNTSFLRP